MLESLALVLLIGLTAVLFLVAEDLLPTYGICWVLAASCMALAMYLAASESTGALLRCVAIEAVLLPVGYLSLSYLISKTGLGRVASLKPPEAHEVDASVGPDLARLVGLRGRALTTLRPSGMVDFDGRRLDGLAEEGLIPVGSSITAVRVSSGRLVVRPSAETPPDTAG
jgi:membrane-bound serine protease (ClpP class)